MSDFPFANYLYLLTNLDDFVNTGICIDVDVADSLTVTQHWNALGCPLNVSHQLGRTSWDNQINHLVQSAQILHLLTSAHLVTFTVWHTSARSICRTYNEYGWTRLWSSSYQ